MSTSTGRAGAVRPRWWVTEAMVLAELERRLAGAGLPVAAVELAAALRGRLPAAGAAEPGLVLAQVIGRLRDLSDDGTVSTSGDYGLVLRVAGASAPAGLVAVAGRSEDRRRPEIAAPAAERTAASG